MRSKVLRFEHDLVRKVCEFFEIMLRQREARSDTGAAGGPAMRNGLDL
jgi:hypothetical protein